MCDSERLRARSYVVIRKCVNILTSYLTLFIYSFLFVSLYLFNTVKYINLNIGKNNTKHNYYMNGQKVEIIDFQKQFRRNGHD